ncbi:MAG: hypothetical protein LBS19_03170 [Clostridiales bacterium]|nr:hypothetical protein [Clostridiales bacterium]
MDNVQIISASEMGELYTSISTAIKNRRRVVITDEQGKGEGVIVNLADYEALIEGDWERYVNRALAEVEAVENDPATWISLEEFLQD